MIYLPLLLLPIVDYFHNTAGWIMYVGLYLYYAAWCLREARRP